MADRLGRAIITWTSTEDTFQQSERVHVLQAPLRELRVGRDMFSALRESLDRTTLEHVSISTGANELVGTIRYDRDSQNLIDLIQAGARGKTLRYIPDDQDPDIQFQVKLVSPLTPASLALDSQRGVLGDHQIELRFRLTDQAPFHPLLHGSNVLFWYRAGDSLAQASTFSRTTSTSAPATYAKRSTGDGGYGTLSTAKDNEARLEWISTASSEGPRDTPVLLLEPASTNLIDESEDFAQWTLGGNAARTSAQADPLGGTAAWLLTSSSNTTFPGIRHTSGVVSTSTQVVLSMFVKANDSTRSFLTSRSSDLTHVLQAAIDWSSGEPTVSSTGWNSGAEPAGTTVGTEERWRNGWWRVQLRSTAALSTGTYQTNLFPSSGNSTKSALFFGAQLEV